MSRASRLIVSVALTAASLSLTAVANASGDDGYVVKDGDTLTDIAAKVGVPLDDLLTVNNLTVTSLIVPGQRLAVPDQAGVAPSAAASGAIHTVVPGDNLGGIAARYEVSLDSLLAVNQLNVTSLITPGMTLAIPVGANDASAAPNSPVEQVIAFALAQIGKPYQFFTAGAATFDCSGLTMAAYRQVGIELVHHSATQAQQGELVDHWNESIRRGDLVFLDNDWDGTIDHVGIALDSSTWVQASQSRDVVLTGPLPPKSVIVAVRRLVATD
jgi:peptidoglycan endopeptidase LytE